MRQLNLILNFCSSGTKPDLRLTDLARSIGHRLWDSVWFCWCNGSHFSFMCMQ